MHYQSFCAANSGKGFFSFFDSITDERDQKVYYIKGGPGCGKSTLMRRIAKEAEEAELILCSSDPDSLDGVILPRQKAVIIDATAPHSFEPRFPGFGGSIIDLGIGFLPERLNKERLIGLFKEKKQLYKSCYKLLSVARTLQEGIFFPLRKEISLPKVMELGDKILKQNALWEERKGKAIPQKRFFCGISPDGLIALSDPFEKLGENKIILEDRWMQSALLLEYISHRLQKRNIPHICGYHPLFGDELLQQIIIPEAKLSIIGKDGFFPIQAEKDTIIRTVPIHKLMNREALAEHKNKLTFFKKTEREILERATEFLKKAKEIHLQIEEEYALGYSFDEAEILKIKLMNNLFG